MSARLPRRDRSMPDERQETLGSALEAFIREHEYCGELDTGLDDDRVWMTCT